MPRPVTMMDVRAALRDERFLAMFPELSQEAEKFRTQRHCGTCGVTLAREVIERFPDRVSQYFPGRKVLPPKEEEAAVAASEDWEVIHCHIDELEARLRKLRPVKKIVTPARWQDQVTVIVQYLNYVEAM